MFVSVCVTVWCVCVCLGSLGCRGDQARCFSNLAFAFSQLGDEEEAAESFIHALQGFRDSSNFTTFFTPIYYCLLLFVNT